MGFLFYKFFQFYVFRNDYNSMKKTNIKYEELVAKKKMLAKTYYLNNREKFKKRALDRYYEIKNEYLNRIQIEIEKND